MNRATNSARIASLSARAYENRADMSSDAMRIDFALIDDFGHDESAYCLDALGNLPRGSTRAMKFGDKPLILVNKVKRDA